MFARFNARCFFVLTIDNLSTFALAIELVICFCCDMA